MHEREAVMTWVQFLQLLQAPAIVAIIGAGSTLIGGVLMGRVKDEQIKAKDGIIAERAATIARLEKFTPAAAYDLLEKLKLLHEALLVEARKQLEVKEEELATHQSLTEREKGELESQLSNAREVITTLEERTAAGSAAEAADIISDIDTSPVMEIDWPNLLRDARTRRLLFQVIKTAAGVAVGL
jgi:hypothetical protein